jgi:hypothetical protein
MRTSDSLAKNWIRERSVEVTLFHSRADWPGITVEAKIDTGADRCSIDVGLAIALGWDVEGERVIRNANGRQTRDYGSGIIRIENEEFLMCATFAERDVLSHPVLIGYELLLEILDLSEEE